MKPPTWGADPEIFMVNGRGSPVPPTSILPDPKHIHRICDKGGINRDGVALELNPDPNEDPLVVALNMVEIFERASAMLGSQRVKATRSLMADIKRIPRTVKKPADLGLLGCDPDIDAYTLLENKPSVNPKKYTLRFAGGHVAMSHPSLIDIPVSQVAELVKLFDYRAGVRSVLWGTEDSLERRKTYGRAGTFRYKPDKGLVEYRTPDAGWFWRGTYQDICKSMHRAFVEWNHGLSLTIPNLVREVIDTCDIARAQELLAEV